MALHMVDDPQDQEEYNDNSGGGGGNRNMGGGGGGGLLSFIPLLLSLFGRGGKGGGGGKGILLLLVVGVGAYFLLGKGGCGGGMGDVAQNLFSQSGYSYSPEEFSKASVYEGLADDNTKNPLPEAVSLAAFAPQRMNQGKQGSCVAWSSAYAAQTILEASSSRTDPNQVAYSPSFLYNNIALDGCQGSYLQKAMEFMQKNGAVPYQDFPYDENDCSRQAASNLYQKASVNKIHGFTRLTETDDVNGINIRAIKEHLSKDAPVVIGMMVGGSFMQGMMGQKVWHPTSEDRNQTGFGGHAMCVVGYNDRVEGGAFEIMNSWGTEWGQNGLAFVRYGDFKEFVREAYGIDPLAKKGAALNVPLECMVGLINNDTRKNIALKPAGANLFKTVTPIAKGSKFKIEIKNNSECYIYIFTPDVNNKSFVLFPYKPIHSSYCGITGYRLFPRKESIQADEIGNKEVMGIVVSKQELDYTAINASINSSTQTEYAAKLNEALAARTDKNIQYSAAANGSIQFKAAGAGNTVVLSIVEIDKQ
jgi:Papain family cysteine protease